MFVISVIFLSSFLFTGCELTCVNFEQIVEISNGRPIAEYNVTNTCYLAFEQGPCKDQEWFIFGNDSSKTTNKTRAGICIQRQCPKHPEHLNTPITNFWFIYQGVCLQTGVEDVDLCDRNSTVYYTEDDEDEPICLEDYPIGSNQTDEIQPSGSNQTDEVKQPRSIFTVIRGDNPGLFKKRRMKTNRNKHAWKEIEKRRAQG